MPILPCLTPMFEKRKPFLYFLPKVGPLEERFREISVNREPWFSMASAGKNLGVKVKCLCSP